MFYSVFIGLTMAIWDKKNTQHVHVPLGVREQLEGDAKNVTFYW